LNDISLGGGIQVIIHDFCLFMCNDSPLFLEWYSGAESLNLPNFNHTKLTLESL
jgi:hypothetical protein